MQSISILLPAYNEAASLKDNFKQIHTQLTSDGLSPQYILVDDGSSDGTWQVINDIKATYDGVVGIKFAKNFGKEIALAAGIDHVTTDLVVIMDSDLQHPPAKVKDMLDVMQTTGADIVLGKKQDRGRESALHRALAKNFYRSLKSLTHLDMQNSSDFMILNRHVVDELKRFSERNLFFRGIVDWVGFKKEVCYFNVEDRHGGQDSRFSTSKLVKLAVNAIIAYTSKPLYLVVLAGAIFGIFAVILGVQTVINYALGNAQDGFSTIILLLLIMGAFIMFSLGIIGVYISRIYAEIKARPRYIIKEKI